MRLVFVIIVLIVSCNKSKKNVALKPSNVPLYKNLFPASPFYDTINTNAEIDENSNLMVKRLEEEVSEQGFMIALKRFTVPVYYCNDTTPRYNVSLLASWAPARVIYDVPIPDYAEPDPGSDGHLVIIDTINKCEYDFWQARKIYNRWFASWGNAIELDGDGIFKYGLSARGSGFALTQGVIFPEELEQGEIKHALIFSYGSPRAGGPVPPASESDGFSDKIYDLPEGALVRLDPKLNLDSLNLTPYEKIIAKALQKYGMYCADAGGGLQLYAVNPICVSQFPYKNTLPDEDYIYLKNIPVSKLQVIKLKPAFEAEYKLIENSCAKFSK